jgi:hypothetical protein
MKNEDQKGQQEKKKNLQKLSLEDLKVAVGGGCCGEPER